MSRYLIDDSTQKDPRALLGAAKLATLSEAALPVKQYITASSTNTLQVEEGRIISIYGGGVFKTGQTVIGESNLDTGSAFAMGKDYYIYLCDPGNNDDEVYRISLNSTYPSGYGAANSRKIGGFHYGKCRKVDNALNPVNGSDVARGSGWESVVFDGIVPRSVWTLAHRPKCNPEGMVYLANGTWIDIYQSSNDGAGGLASAYNSTPLTGTEGLNWYDFVERALVVGKRLPSYSEWLQMAFGSPGGLDASNTNAWTATTNTAKQKTGYVANAVSSIGCRDAVGNVWEWCDELISNLAMTQLAGGTFGAYDGARAGKTIPAQTAYGNGHHNNVAVTSGFAPGPRGAYDAVSPFPAGYGNIYQYYDYSLVALVAGGSWASGVNAGARTVHLYNYPWHVNTNIGARCACDSL